MQWRVSGIVSGNNGTPLSITPMPPDREKHICVSGAAHERPPNVASRIA
jgi:hypothetical protein